VSRQVLLVRSERRLWGPCLPPPSPQKHSAPLIRIYLRSAADTDGGSDGFANLDTALWRRMQQGKEASVARPEATSQKYALGCDVVGYSHEPSEATEVFQVVGDKLRDAVGEHRRDDVGIVYLLAAAGDLF